MRTHRPLSLGGLALLVALAGCAGMQNLLGGFERPTLTFQSIALQGLDLEGVTVAVHYRLDNPNSVGVKLARLGYALDLEGQRTASGEMPMGLDIPARGSAPLTIPVKLHFRSIPGLLQTLLTHDSVGYRISGHAGVDTPVGVIDLPLSQEGRAAVPKL